MSAKMQMQALAIAGAESDIVFMDDAEVKAAIEQQNYGRAWTLWRRQGMELLAAGKAKSGQA